MQDTDNTVAIDPRHPEPGVIERAAELVCQGRVVVFPTSGLYGLGADALDQHAVDHVFAIKGRSPDKPLLVLIDHPQMMDQVTGTVSPMARFLMKEFWPGKVTFVLAAKGGLPRGLTSDGGARIGVRLAAHPVAFALVRAMGRPLTGTSANVSGAGGCASVTLLDPNLRKNVALILDAGDLTGGSGSTVVDVGGEIPLVLRQGAVPEAAVLTAFHRFHV